MTPQERQLIADCGTFCHVTTLNRAGEIDVRGLHPSVDESFVIRGPSRPKAVYFTPRSKLNTALEFIGDRARDQKRLVVFQIAAAVLVGKSCGPDFGWLAALLAEEKIESATIATSLHLGGLACYIIVLPAEFKGRGEVDNPRYDGVKLV